MALSVTVPLPGSFVEYALGRQATVAPDLLTAMDTAQRLRVGFGYRYLVEVENLNHLLLLRDLAEQLDAESGVTDAEDQTMSRVAAQVAETVDELIAQYRLEDEVDA